MTRRSSTAAASLPEPKRCAIYTRKSTSQGLDQEFNTLDAQWEACEHYIASQSHNGWQLIPEHYDDGGFTGANLERPAFLRLLEDVDAGRIDIVVVYKVDRLSRSLLDFARVMDRLNRAGAAFVSVTQNFSTTDAMGRLTLNMLMSFAEFEREMIGERTRDKMAAARRKGKWTGGPVPLGYDVVDKHLVVNELEAVIVREVFSLYEQHRSALDVARLLNACGRTTKRHRAQNGNLRGGGKWLKDAVLRILRNPVFAGYMPCNGEVHEGEHEAIVDPAVWHRSVAILDGQSGPRCSHPRNPAYLLRGILRCGSCGGAMTPASTRKSGREYRYYRCSIRVKEGNAACPARPLPAEAIEGFVVERIREATADGNLAHDVTRKLQARIARERKDLLVERRELPGLIARLSAERRELVGMLARAEGTARRLLEEKIEEIGERLAVHEGRLAEVERALAALAETEIETEWVTVSLARFDSVWDAMNVQNRARLVRALVERVEIDEPNGRITAELVDLGTGDDAPGLGDERSPVTEAA